MHTQRNNAATHSGAALGWSIPRTPQSCCASPAPAAAALRPFSPAAKPGATRHNPTQPDKKPCPPSRSCGRVRVRSCDPGWAGCVQVDTYCMTPETGSYRYMAPEVFRHEAYDWEVDVYSWAIVAFEILEARRPMASAPVRVLRVCSDSPSRFAPLLPTPFRAAAACAAARRQCPLRLLAPASCGARGGASPGRVLCRIIPSSRPRSQQGPRAARCGRPNPASLGSRRSCAWFAAILRMRSASARWPQCLMIINSIPKSGQMHT